MKPQNIRPMAAAAALATLLTGCGGDGGDADGTGTATPAGQTLSGVVARGAAWAGVVVTAKCGTGSYTSAPTGSTGAYAISLPAGALPCVLEAGDGSSRLHSVATGTTAQVTPLTELLVAQLAGTDPTSFVSSTAASSLASTVTAQAVASAQAQVLALLGAAGVSTSGITDLVAGPLSAGSGSGYDGVLDALARALTTAGTTLTQLTGNVVGSSGASPLAAELLLKPAAASCSALRATDYWLVNTGAPGGGAVERLQVRIGADGQPSVVGYLTPDGSSLDTAVVTLTANGECRFSTSDGSDVMVAPSGVIIGRGDDGHAFAAVPVQAHTLDELVGDWNMLASDVADDGAGWTFGYGTVTISSAGYEQFRQGCWFGSQTSSNCTPIPDVVLARKRPVAVLADGSYTTHSDDSPPGEQGPWMERSFVYRTGQGDYIAIGTNVLTPDGKGDGSVSYATKARALALPTVGTVSRHGAVYWNWSTGASTVAPDVTVHTIQSVDPAAGSFVRLSGAPAAATHPETLFINQPLAGLQRREEASGVPTSDGNTVNVRASILLRAGGSGFTASLQPYESTNRPARIVLSAALPG